MAINAKYRVDIMESERGWGQKIDESRYFDSKAEADEFVRTHNARNDKPQAPDIYWKALPPVLVDMSATP